MNHVTDTPQGGASWQRIESRLLEACDQWIDQLVDPRDALYDDDGQRWSQLGSLDSFNSGRSPLHSEQDLGEIRRQCRALALTNEYAINGHENRISYLVGSGHSYRVQSLPNLTDNNDLVEEAQRIIDQFLRANQWHRRQQELVLRVDRDGEAFVRLFRAPDGSTQVRFVEPSQVASPPERGGDPQCSFGIHTDPLDVEHVLGYYVDGVYVEALEIQHRKANVDSNVKRGLPLFYAVRKNLRRAEKLLRNMSVVAEIQSAIALIRRHRSSRGSVEQFVSQQADAAGVSPSARPSSVHRYGPGTILDTHADVEYDFPVAAIDAGRYVTVLQAELRAIAARLVMPEFMLSSDASNANYASTMVAEGPAVRMFERLQQQLIEWDETILRCVVEHAIAHGLLPADTLDRVHIAIVAPSLDVRDKLQEAQTQRIAFEAGILSPQTWTQMLGLDYAREQAGIDSYRAAGSRDEQQQSGNFVS